MCRSKKKKDTKIEVSSEDSDSCIEHMVLNSIKMEEKNTPNEENRARTLDYNSKSK